MRRSGEGGNSAECLVPALGRLLVLTPRACGSVVAKQLGVGERVPLAREQVVGGPSLCARPDLDQME